MKLILSNEVIESKQKLFANIKNIQAAKYAWKLVEGGGYPFIYNRSTGKRCLENLSFIPPSKINGRKDTFPNHRGNFGRVVTTQGISYDFFAV